MSQQHQQSDIAKPAAGTRRRFVEFLTVSGFALTPVGCDVQTEQVASGPGPMSLSEGDKVAINGKTAAILDQAYDLGWRYEDQHKGCAQCTVAALQDAVEFVPADGGVFQAASCVDGGATPDKQGTCGAFTGAGMIIGSVCGRSRDNFSGQAGLARKLFRQVHQKFSEAYGGVLCGQVRAASGADCNEVVGRSAQWTAEILLNQFASSDGEDAGGGQS